MAGSKILLLGAGFVAHPTLTYLANKGNSVTVACRSLKKAQDFCNGTPNTTGIELDVNNDAELEKAVAAHDLTISLIPYTFHVKVIKAAIKHKKNVCTTSYVSDAIRALDKEAKDAGCIIMNEIGVDPGIDHLYAVKTISEVHEQGGQIKGFISFCGGLPAPECADNPLGYKFSWSSRGVLLALRNSAQFYENGKLVHVNGPDLMSSVRPYTEIPGFNLVCYANRDSTLYRDLYKIPEAETVLRGTLRYPGFPEFVATLVDMGFLSDEPRDFLNEPITWAEATRQVLGASSADEKDLEWAVASKAKFPDTAAKEHIMDGLRWLDMFSTSKKITPRGNPLDTLCATLEEKMQYKPGERDMLVLQHRFDIEDKDGSKHTRYSTLVDYGDPAGYSSMAKLVGTPCGIATQLILDGVINTPGVLAPMSPEINNPIMKQLKEEFNIFLTEEEK